MTQTAERDFPAKKRAKMDVADFGDPAKKAFPVITQDDLDNAARLLGHADNPAAVKKRLIAIAKRRGLTLPDSWKDDESKNESSGSVSLCESSLRPRSRIATIQVVWIEDNARSLNGRVYLSSTVDRLIASANRKLSDPASLPLTCFLSHAAADGDETRDLVGKLTKVWREGGKGMALIDLADTTAARDALALIAGGYLCTESLRAKNAELRTDPQYDVPVVAGDSIELEGIDLTNYPGLEQVARIQQVQIAESAQETASLTEVFPLPSHSLSISEEYYQKDEPMTKETEGTSPGVLTEGTAGGNAPASTAITGTSVGMTDDPTQDTYSQRMYKPPQMTTGPMQGMTQVSGVDVQEAHDRIAMVQNRACAPDRESVRYQHAIKTLSERDRTLLEAGKSISAKNDAHLDAAHHAVARHLGMDCEGVNNKIDPDGDGDDDRTNDPVKNPDWAQDQQNNNMESKKGTSPMSKEEALKLLEAQGYDVRLERKKTEAERMQEQLEALKAAQTQQMEEMRALITSQQQPATLTDTTPDPQRRSVVSGANTPAGNKGSIRSSIYQHGKYLREQINKADWLSLTDRTCPLPDGIDLEHLIREFEQLYAVQYDDRFQVLSATELR